MGRTAKKPAVITGATQWAENVMNVWSMSVNLELKFECFECLLACFEATFAHPLGLLILAGVLLPVGDVHRFSSFATL